MGVTELVPVCVQVRRSSAWRAKNKILKAICTIYRYNYYNDKIEYINIIDII
jgi:hypothetical protein